MMRTGAGCCYAGAQPGPPCVGVDDCTVGGGDDGDGGVSREKSIQEQRGIIGLPQGTACIMELGLTCSCLDGCQALVPAEGEETWFSLSATAGEYRAHDMPALF